jgi:hypothetical protein
MRFSVRERITYVVEACIVCGVTFAMPEDFHEARKHSKANFWCPNGHAQHYTGVPLLDQLAEMDTRARQAELHGVFLEDQLAARQQG